MKLDEKTLTRPQAFTEMCIARLREDGSIYAVERGTSMANFIASSQYSNSRYPHTYWYGDILAVARVTYTCVGFSHWYHVSGGDSYDIPPEPVWRWDKAYEILERYTVGRKGVLKRLA